LDGSLKVYVFLVFFLSEVHKRNKRPKGVSLTCPFDVIWCIELYFANVGLTIKQNTSTKIKGGKNQRCSSIVKIDCKIHQHEL
jgi:hypothetical protein